MEKKVLYTHKYIQFNDTIMFIIYSSFACAWISAASCVCVCVLHRAHMLHYNSHYIVLL